MYDAGDECDEYSVYVACYVDRVGTDKRFFFDGAPHVGGRHVAGNGIRTREHLVDVSTHKADAMTWLGDPGDC